LPKQRLDSLATILVLQVKHLRPDYSAGFARFLGASEVLGDVFLVADAQWKGSSREHCLMLSRHVTLAPGQSLTAPMLLGYQNHMEVKREAEQTGAYRPRGVAPHAACAEWKRQPSKRGRAVSHG
jgi:hypothetical protein